MHTFTISKNQLSLIVSALGYFRRTLDEPSSKAIIEDVDRIFEDILSGNNVFFPADISIIVRALDIYTHNCNKSTPDHVELYSELSRLQKKYATGH